MNDKFITVGALFGLVLLAGALVYGKPSQTSVVTEETVTPAEGVMLPVVLGDLWEKLVAVGAIDEKQFAKQMIETKQNMRITRENAHYLLNLLWAFGLANKNPILESGEMVDPKYGGAGNFASTGGWTASVGKAMDHYSRHELVVLTDEQQTLVDRVSQNIYRPCCGNSTHFPDCNHGMAMLGFLELMASQGVGEQEMYKAALAVNSYWFPQNYLTIAMYLQMKGIAWENADPRELLGSNFSSGAGYSQISSQVTLPDAQQGGGSCSV